MSREEFIRLVKLNFYCPKECLAERKALRLECIRMLLQHSLTATKTGLHWVLPLLGLLFVLALLAAGLRPPITPAVIPTLSVAAILLLVLLPPTSRFMKNWMNGWLLIGLRALLVISGAATFSSQMPLIESARRQAMPDMARRALEKEERDDAAKKQHEAERESTAAQARLDDVRRNERVKASAAERREEIAVSDREQRDFYDTLGAPKLLYRCSSDQPLRAVGATRGSINVILQSAQAECSSSSFEIVKRKEN